ncbi:uncharacterized protein LOC134236413 [Saccostrea cucullata]|uniref:uncharacterized protein LOC134236413 n=1 Tax=Saccostrea cuccullata TaxID=36930 RepID=UPI002ED43D23
MMLLCKCLILVLLAAPFVKLDHFRGGLFSWKAFNETQITVHHRLSFVYNESCPNRNSSATISCFPKGGCNDNATMIGLCTQANSTENWADSEGDTNFTITNSTSTNVYFIGYSGSAWISLEESASSWSLRMTVDVSTRTDTGTINQSPVSAMASSIIVGYCSYISIIIPVADYDGDNVRCRLPTTTEECGDICNKTSIISGFNEEFCGFYIAGHTFGIYAMAIQIEDFKNSTSTSPLSSIPLQFIITVTSDGACYFEPIFVSPTPTEGNVIQVHNGSLQFKARARISVTPESISRFHILSPLDFTISAISYPVLYEYETTISKTDILAEEIGIYVLCFSAESNYRRSTGSRCITVNITDIDECAENSCQNNATCVDLMNDYNCSCEAGLNGTNC